jgi:hypothetical protein
MSSKPETKFNIDFDGLWIALLLLSAGIGWECTPKERAKNPHSLGAAITCRIGGAAFCPKVQP